MKLSAALLAVASLGACEGTTGTINLDLTMAPGSTVLDPVTRLRLTLSNHDEVQEATRNASGGFDLSLSLTATGDIDALLLEGYDDAGALRATGSSPPFALGPTNARIVIYVAAPMSVAAAPVALGPARSSITGVALPYGALFAGGNDAAGAPSDALAVYNVYDHSLTGGVVMPIKRTGFAMAATSNGGIYLIGGLGTDGNPVSTVLRFDTTVQPAGAYTSLGDQPAFARTGEAAVAIGNDRFLFTGSPPGELAGGTLAARTELATLPAVGAATTPTDGVRTAVFVGDTGLIRFRDDRFDALAGTGRVRSAIAELPAIGKLVVAGGGTPTAPVRDVLLVDPATGLVEVHTNALATARFSPAIAATTRYVVIAGGTDAADAPIATAEILDATTLAPVATVPIAARAGSIAFALENGQVLIAGGSPATDLLELFTPPPP